MNPAAAKRALRDRLRETLRQVDPADLERHSAAIADAFIASAPYTDCRTLVAYLSLPREVCTDALVEQAWRDGKRVLAPRVGADDTTLELVEIRSWSDVKPGFRGIREPTGTTIAAAGPSTVLLVPGLGFTDDGRRLGRGGGHYDRLLRTLSDDTADPVLPCGIVLEAQLVPDLPAEPHDQRVRMIVTEHRLIMVM